jgi:rare lipoprotein A
MFVAVGAASVIAAGVIFAGAVNAETAAQNNVNAPKISTAAKSALAAKPTTTAKSVERPASVESGIASVYCFRNGPTASGERSRPALLTAAHKTLPFGTLVEVTNRQNGRAVVVRINDRGPYVGGRVIDLTPAAARALKFDGLTHVTVRVLNNRRDLRLVARAI